MLPRVSAEVSTSEKYANAQFGHVNSVDWNDEMERWSGLLKWSTELEYWSAMSTKFKSMSYYIPKVLSVKLIPSYKFVHEPLDSLVEPWLLMLRSG